MGRAHLPPATSRDEVTVPKRSIAYVRIAHMRFEHCREYFGLGIDLPRLSWVVEDAAPGWRQAAHEVQARAPGGQLSSETGRIESEVWVLAPWPFAPLRSRDRLEVRVRAWGVDGEPSE
jgi:alpha-L-rhamnosidase